MRRGIAMHSTCCARWPSILRTLCLRRTGHGRFRN